MEHSRVRYRLVPDPGAHFDASVPMEVQRSLFAGIVQAYSDSYTLASGRFDPGQGRIACGHWRHAECEKNLEGVAARFEAAHTDLVPNQRGTHHHIEFRCGGVVLTASITQGPQRLPSDAKFRRHLYASNSVHLFDPPEEGDEPLYCVLAHGVHGSRYTDRPSFVTVLFPDPTGRGIVGATDLHARFAAAAPDAFEVAVKEAAEEEQLVRMKDKRA